MEKNEYDDQWLIDAVAYDIELIKRLVALKGEPLTSEQANYLNRVIAYRRYAMDELTDFYKRLSDNCHEEYQKQG